MIRLVKLMHNAVDFSIIITPKQSKFSKTFFQTVYSQVFSSQIVQTNLFGSVDLYLGTRGKSVLTGIKLFYLD